MNWLDLVILFPIGYFAYRGFVNGLVKEVFSIVGIVLAVFVTFTYMGKVSVYLKPYIDQPPDILILISGVFLFIGILVVVHFTAFLIRKLLEVIKLNILNSIFGFVFGGIKSAIVISAFLLFLTGFDMPDVDVRNQSLSYSPVIRLAPKAYDVIATMYPGVEDFVSTIQDTFEEANPIQNLPYFNQVL
ncbi:MAG: CvpA family protein [Balneolaceae bacterium]